MTALEAEAALAEGAPAALRAAGLGGAVTQRIGPLEAGWAADGPFGAILVNGAVELVPPALFRQLAPGGRLACLVGDAERCSATLYVRSGDSFGPRALFEAGAPILDAFRAPPAFTF